LYYISTNDPDINVSRVEFRVTKKGHSVSLEIIKSRYKRSLSQLQLAVSFSDRAYIFDNSGAQAELVAEITDESEVRLNFPEKVPFWVEKYLLGS
jgi:predicted ABC-type ATPase